MGRIQPEVLSNKFLFTNSFFKDYLSCYQSDIIHQNQPGWENDCLTGLRIDKLCSNISKINFTLQSQSRLCPEYFQTVRSYSKSPNMSEWSGDQNMLKEFYKYEQCISKLKPVIDKCVEKTHLEEKCKARTIRAAKVLRLLPLFNYTIG